MKKCSKCKIIKNLTEFYPRPERKEGKAFRSNCKLCDKIKKEKYYSTEEGFMKKLFLSINDRKNAKTRRSMCYPVDFTKEEFLELWQEYKKKYGMFCFYTGVPLNFIKSSDFIRGNQVSVDRIDNSKGYSKDNIIFCSSKANLLKGSVSIDMCHKILALYEERQGLTKPKK